MKKSIFHRPDIFEVVSGLINNYPNIQIELSSSVLTFDHSGETVEVCEVELITIDGIEDDFTYYELNEANEDMQLLEDIFPDNIVIL